MMHDSACKQCNSDSCSEFPADVRLYLNGSRTMSAPPVNPAPKIRICLRCGWSEFSVSSHWLAARWLRPIEPPPVFAGVSVSGTRD